MGRHHRKPRNRDLLKMKRSEKPPGTSTERKQFHDDGRVILRENEMFEKFYKAQNLVPEEEWDTLMSCLRRDLPASFRLVGCRKETSVLMKLLKERYLSKMSVMEIDGIPVEPPTELPWYPGGLGYQMTLPRHVVRKQPILSAFHNFLVTETEMGNVSRQETVSMIPPLLLDVQPHHKVFDMCAAPGSKTAQLIEMLHGSGDEDQIPSGFILANDFDNKRCYLLVHQSLKRLNSPCCLISNSDASFMPNIQISDENGQLKPMRFDRILCDVPCSGDGTLRKNAGIWKQWSLYHAYNLHKLQFRIARRGLEMLAVGGILVYSTCSLNPAENEATVYSLLEFAGGAVEIVDVSEKLPLLKRRPGLHSWKILDKNGETYSTCEEMPTHLRKQIPPSVFPPSESAAREAHLERCIRIVPHDQDTGGFFVAVLRKTREFNQSKASRSADSQANNASADSATDHQESEPVPEAVKDSSPSVDSEISVPPEKKPKFSGFKEDPFTFLSESDSWWGTVKEYFDAREDFPRSQILFRCDDQKKKKNAYFVNKTVKDVLQNNGDKIKFINAGLRLFTRTDEKEDRCHYRLAQESLSIIVPYINKRVIEAATEDDLTKVIRSPNVLLNDLSPATRAQLSDIAEGSVAVVYKDPKTEQTFMLSGWRGKVSIAAYVTQENRVHILRMLGQDTSSIEEEMIRQRKKAPAKEENDGSEANEIPDVSA